MLTKDEILKSFERLSDELGAIGLHGELLLTGGASMCLVHSARDVTKDVDALYEPKTIINQIAIKIAQDYGWPENWLNDSVKGFITDIAPQEDFISFANLKISTVSADYLLAMKLMSARYGETDYGDIQFLVYKLGLQTEEDMREVVMKYFSIDNILPKTKYLIEQIVSELSLEINKT